MVLLLLVMALLYRLGCIKIDGQLISIKIALNRVQFYEFIQGSAIKVRISNHLFSFQKLKNQ